jgi:molybdenum cofactor synthesis domain-containing protein
MSKISYTAALVIIGNEILSGRTQDANTYYIAQKLNDHGIVLSEVRVVPDVESKVIETVNAVRAEYDYVFTTGGIGPTHDDITAECVAKAFDVELEQNPDARELLLKHYGEADLNEARLRMARIPAGAVLIENPVSAAPGFQMGNVYVMAGVPKIMQAMMEGVLPNLQGGAPVLSNTVTCAIPESQIAPELGELQKECPAIDIGSYPNFRGGVLGLSVVARGTDGDLLKSVTDKIVEIIRAQGEEPTAMSLLSEARVEEV